MQKRKREVNEKRRYWIKILLIQICRSENQCLKKKKLLKSVRFKILLGRRKKINESCKSEFKEEKVRKS